MIMIPQEQYMEKIARMNLSRFTEQGFASAGHNGPHGHLDTPVRNTSHYLIIYSYLYKKYKEEPFQRICNIFYEYLRECQKKSASGAIQCMISDRFDHLNGLIGQGWVIEALIYYYEVFHVQESLDIARKIFYSQQYNWKKHLWHRIELDGSDIGIDVTSNHNVWFAGCAYKLADYCKDQTIDAIIRDFLIHGQHIILNTYSNGLMVHPVVCDDPQFKKGYLKKIIRLLLSPVKFMNPRKLDTHYMEYAYHIYDMYGYSLLKSKYGDLPLYDSSEYKMALKYASNINELLKSNKVESLKRTNVYFYPYNSPAFEWPFVARTNGFGDLNKEKLLWIIQCDLMMDNQTGVMSRNNPDIETWNARTYEIIRFLEN